jgi:hypothetical protein
MSINSATTSSLKMKIFDLVIEAQAWGYLAFGGLVRDVSPIVVVVT